MFEQVKTKFHMVFKRKEKNETNQAAKPAKRRSKKLRNSIIAVLARMLIAGGGYFGYTKLFGSKASASQQTAVATKGKYYEKY